MAPKKQAPASSPASKAKGQDDALGAHITAIVEQLSQKPKGQNLSAATEGRAFELMQFLGEELLAVSYLTPYQSFSNQLIHTLETRLKG